MFKKIAALVAALLMVGGIAAPAGAASTPLVYNMKPGVGIQTGAYIDFQRQGDGDGVRVIAYVVKTGVGCGDLERDAPYGDVSWSIQDDDTSTVLSRGEASFLYACDEARWPPNVFGPDAGAADFTLTVKVRRQWAPDHYAYWVWRIYPSGNSVLRGKGTYAA